VFSAIEVVCEGSILRTQSGRALAKLIAKLCRDEGGKQVRAYDRLRKQERSPTHDQ